MPKLFIIKIFVFYLLQLFLQTILIEDAYINIIFEVQIMKTLIWVIILFAIFFGGYKLYQKYSAKSEAQTAAVSPATATPASERAVFPESTPGKPNSEKGIKNWRAIKKVRNLSDQHQKDLQDNM